MQNPQGFDYSQPNRATLAGIYVEVSDSAAQAPAPGLPVGQERPVALAEIERLFGLTVTVGRQPGHGVIAGPKATAWIRIPASIPCLPGACLLR
jgi:hypothetical protein